MEIVRAGASQNRPVQQLSTTHGENSTASLAAAPAALPETDEGRLLFYSEVLMANISTLMADLGSTKYTLLSFTEKVRNEVRQKSALLQSFSRTFTALVNTRKTLEAEQKRLTELETKLVTAAPPKFMTSEEALQLNRSNSSTTAGSTSHPTILILNEEDLEPVRRAEALLEKQTTSLVAVSKRCNEMETAFDASREQCQEMTDVVQRLKWKYDEVYKSWKQLEVQRKMVAMMREEAVDRRGIAQDALQNSKALEAQCSDEERAMIEALIETKKAEVKLIKTELSTKKESHEVDLAAFQIAYKGQQGSVERLKESCTQLAHHLQELELLGKKQQIEETQRHSLRRLMTDTLTLNFTKFYRPEERQLSSEQDAELKRDHPLVSILSARIAAMEEQRKTIAGLLVSAHHIGNAGAIPVIVEHIQSILESDLQLDNKALEM